jgi:hypothetical protein
MAFFAAVEKLLAGSELAAAQGSLLQAAEPEGAVLPVLILRVRNSKTFYLVVKGGYEIKSRYRPDARCFHRRAAELGDR